MSQKEIIAELVKQAGTDSSGKWMSVHHAEKFAKLVIDAYNKDSTVFQQSSTKSAQSKT